MKLFACIKKDIELICGGGIKSLLYLVLPVLLMLLLTFYMSGLAKSSNYTEPFAIAVRDEDDTVMSTLLKTQLRGIPIFGEVRTVKGGSDESCLEDGCAAVITIPKDLFYDLYDMKDTDVRITLNGDMPREAAMVKSAVASLAGIIEQNQKVYYAAARVRYGELSDEQMERIYYEYSEASVTEALNRLDFFELSSLYADEEANASIFFASGVCSMLIMFIPLCILRSLYDERQLGITARLKAAGGGIWQTVFAKLLAAFIMTAAPVAAVLILTRTAGAARLIPALLVLFLASFGFFLMLSLLCRSGERAQLIGNMLMLLMLVIGGAFFPYRLLPYAVQRLSPVSLPYYTTKCFYAAYLGRSLGDTLKTLWPVAVCIPVFTAVSLLLYGPLSGKARWRP